MIAPVEQLKKSDIIWLGKNRCRHFKTYLEHYNCFLTEKPESPFEEKIAFLDLECSGLKANWDFILCYCLKPLDGKIIGRHVTPKEILSYQFDKFLVHELLVNMSEFHRIIVYYGRDYRYDLPFVRTRAEQWGLDFPAYRDKWVTDVYDIAKAKLCLHSTRLEHVCKLLGIPSKGHRLEPDIWQKAQAGHVPSLKFIFTHCKEDVISLEGAWRRLVKYVGKTKRSI